MSDLSMHDVRQALRDAGRTRPFRRGQLLMSAGAPSDEVLLIESGAVKVMLSAADGSESIVGVYGKGELIGELGVLSGEPRSATVIAHLDGYAVHVPRTSFLRLLGCDRRALMAVNETLRRRLQHADRRQLAFASLDVPARVAAQLVAWAKAYGERTPAGVVIRGLTQRDLALAVAASEKTVEAVLRRLRGDGLLSTGRRRYVLPDLARMERFAIQQAWKSGE